MKASRSQYGYSAVDAGQEPLGMSRSVHSRANLDEGTITLTIARQLRGESSAEYVDAGLSLESAKELCTHLSELIRAVEVQPVVMEPRPVEPKREIALGVAR